MLRHSLQRDIQILAHTTHGVLLVCAAPRRMGSCHTGADLISVCMIPDLHDRGNENEHPLSSICHEGRRGGKEVR